MSLGLSNSLLYRMNEVRRVNSIIIYGCLIVIKFAGKLLFTCSHPPSLLVEKPEGEVLLLKFFPTVKNSGR
jgi:hypothetical protein